jgi:hypothetical protein
MKNSYSHCFEFSQVTQVQSLDGSDVVFRQIPEKERKNIYFSIWPK